MRDTRELLQELVTANHILAFEGVVDAFGHISARHPDRPDRFILSQSRSPELIAIDDLMEFELDGTPVEQRGRTIYAERFIHAALYDACPQVQSVVHNHSHAVIPYGVTGTALRPVVHVAAPIGSNPPTWDIHDRFGDTDLLVSSLEQGRDLARTIGASPFALMRGHGCVATGKTIREAVMVAIYAQVNAKLQMDALALGEPRYLTHGEVELAMKRQLSPLAIDRCWEYWARRAGV